MVTAKKWRQVFWVDPQNVGLLFRFILQIRAAEQDPEGEDYYYQIFKRINHGLKLYREIQVLHTCMIEQTNGILRAITWQILFKMLCIF